MPCHLNNTTAPSADFDASAAEADALRTSAAAEVLPGSGCSLNAAGSGATPPRHQAKCYNPYAPCIVYLPTKLGDF